MEDPRLDRIHTEKIEQTIVGGVTVPVISVPLKTEVWAARGQQVHLAYYMENDSNVPVTVEVQTSDFETVKKDQIHRDHVEARVLTFRARQRFYNLNVLGSGTTADITTWADPNNRQACLRLKHDGYSGSAQDSPADQYTGTNPLLQQALSMDPWSMQ